jgi:hypothetical protein
VAATAIAMLIAWWGTRWGAGTSPDSNRYLSAAVSIAESWRLDSYTGTPLTQFPPGYPVVVRLVMIPGLSWQTAARTICILTAGALVVATAAVARRVVSSPVLRGTVIVTAVVAPTFTTINRMAWTEPLFIVVMLALVAVLIDIDHAAAPPTRRLLVTLAGLTSAAVLLRYAGLGLVPGVAASLALIGRRRHQWLGGVVAYVSMSAIVPALWFMRNLVVSGDIGGPPLPARGSLWSDLGLVLEAIGRGLLPVLAPSETTSTLVGTLAAGALVALTVLLVRQGPHRDVVILSSLSGFLLLQLIVSARTTWVAIGNRMLSPLLIPAVLIVAIAADRWLMSRSNDDAPQAASPDKRRRGARWAAAAAALVLLVGWTIETTDATAVAHDRGVGTTGAFWRNPTLSDDLGLIPEDARVVSNEAGAIWNITGRFPVLELFGGDRQLTDAERCAGAYLVWFELEPGTPNWVPADATPLAERRRWSVNLLSAADCADDDG